jgi:hypothetical protein
VAILPDMRTNFVNRLTLGLAVLGLSAIAPAAFGQSMTLQKGRVEVEHLTCTKDTQGLMCKPQVQDSKVVPQAAMAADSTAAISAPQWISAGQLSSFSDVLLGGLYFVLPVGVGLAMFLHDEQTKRFAKRIDRLERLWNNHPQH